MSVVGQLIIALGAKERRITMLETVIEHQKKTIERQGNANEARHNILCEIKEITDHYFMKG